ncbi:Uma2 family endonuclease [Lacrimispora sp.]|uniref:Uma2 family endonuclease n=1 Tax=Lacrimispora sp. TaxID=2719234 RepID=UPI0034606F51
MPLLRKQMCTIDDIYNLPDGTRAELIDGQMYMMAPPSRIHQEILMQLSTTINSHIKANGGTCKVYPAPFAVFLNDDNTTYVEPDISVICTSDKLNDKGCVGAPDWIIEITSPGNTSHDYIKKLNLYADANVREYWIVNPIKKSIVVYNMENDSTPIIYTFNDKVKVNIFESLTIDFNEII